MHQAEHEEKKLDELLAEYEQWIVDNGLPYVTPDAFRDKLNAKYERGDLSQIEWKWKDELDLWFHHWNEIDGSSTRDYRSAIANLVGHVLSKSDLDRPQIADRMSEITGVRVSKFMLDAWSSPGREAHNMPAWVIPALGEVCGTKAIIEWLARRHFGGFITARQGMMLSYGETVFKQRQYERLAKTTERALERSCGLADISCGLADMEEDRNG